jgi:uncharacterized membrane protein YesL
VLKPDGWLYETLDRIWTAVFLNALWILCCLPVFTVGAATCACYETARKTLIMGSGESMPRVFFSTFAANFRQATIIGVSIEVVAAVSAVGGLAAGGALGGAVYAVLAAETLLCMAAFFWSEALAARFENTTFGHIRAGVFMTVRHIGYSAAIIVLMGIIAYAVDWFFPLILFAPVLTVVFWAWAAERVFEKHIGAPEAHSNGEE